MSVPILAQDPAPITPEDRPYRYPDPVALARNRASRIEGHAAWGAVGGLTTLFRHGREHYRRMAARRWRRA